VLLHLIDGSQPDPVRAYETVRGECEDYGGGLIDKPEIIALNKTDAMTPQARSSRVKALERATGKPVRLISGVTGEGVQEVLRELADTIYRSREEAAKA
jgi:GTP-binding protein